MRRRWPSVLLAALLTATAIPAFAAEPDAGPTPEPVPSEEPVPSVDPGGSTDPVPDSVGAADLGSDLDTAGRFIVVLKPNVDPRTVRERHARVDGVRAERVFDAVRAFSARLSPRQRAALAADPSVAAVVPDEIIHLAAQSVPTGVRRVGARAEQPLDVSSGEGVDADIAIVDTGLDRWHPDLNVQGGINCSTSDPAAWRDVHGHGTHVAGIAAARDDDYGVVGVAPGARLWAVKILNDNGNGLLSWYVCGLDWIAAQRDENDPDRPMIEAVNMSVAKAGSDDRNCGLSNADILHQAICRLTATGVTVIAAAANESTYASRYVPAAYDEVITVSALADTDGAPGGLGPVSSCGGTPNADDAFASFSNFGSDIDLMAPGKCIRSTLPGSRFGTISGTSMAAPHVSGAVALYKATRPWATTGETLEALQVLGSMNWKTSTDPDGNPDTLLDVSRLGPYGTFSLAFGRSSTTGAPGGSVSIPISILRSATHIERVTLSAEGPAGFPLSFNQSSVFGPSGTVATLSVAIPASANHGSYTLTATGREHGRTREASTELIVAPVETTGARYVAIEPSRLLDTRTGTGLSGSFRDSTPRTFQIAGRGGIPAGAVAVTGNLTVTGQATSGYVALGPTVSASPSTSVLNVPAADNRAVGVTVALAANGSLSAVWKGGGSTTAHLLFDVTGYFVKGSDGLTFRALTPARLLDTRSHNGLSGAFRSGTVRTVLIAGRRGVPADAIAITANLTIVDQTSSGYVSVGPTMTSDPLTSTLNVPRGDVRANATTVKLAGTGTLDLVWKGRPGSTANLILDVTGYFTASSTGATFHAVAPTRIVDSRVPSGLPGPLPSSSVRAFRSTALGPVPSDAIAVTGILTITGQSSGGYLSLGPTMTARPATSNLNAPRGDDRANGFVSLVAVDGRLSIVWVGVAGSRTHALVDVMGFYR